MIWKWYQLTILAVVNFFAGFCFGYLYIKTKRIIEVDELKHIHEDDGKLYTQTGFEGDMIELTTKKLQLFKNNKRKCLKCGEFYR